MRNCIFQFVFRGDTSGHILGLPEEIGQPDAVRGMSVTSCAVTRLFLHTAMFVGASTGLKVGQHVLVSNPLFKIQ